MAKDYQKLAAILLNDIERLMDIWLPDGRPNGNEYKALNPTRSDSEIGSFSVNMRSGKWSDFATDDVGGDLISLYAYLNGIDNSTAYNQLSDEPEIINYAANSYVPKKPKIDEWELLPLPKITPSGDHYELGIPISRYRYETFYIMRYLLPNGQKDIRPLSYRRNINTGAEEWRWKGVATSRPLYRKETIRDLPILIVEGEKAADVVVYGYTVVTWAGGSKAVKKTDWSPLYGRQDVYIWGDRDEAGYAAMLDIKNVLPLAHVVNVDFSIGDGQDIADIEQKEIQEKLFNFVMPPSKADKKEEVRKLAEIVVNYNTKYPDIIDAKSGVIVARTGSGKTFKFENQPDTMILVPRIIQANIETGEDVEYLFHKTFTEGSILTYNKFYGHYQNDDRFADLIDRGRIKLVVDEAHILTSIPIKMHRIIYKLNAVFMSGTLEKFFRMDLQRYKYKPAAPEEILFTDGELPMIDGSIVFVENATAIELNYPDACITSTARKHKNVDIHTTKESVVYATSALREGISVKNEHFKACMVYKQSAPLWSTKDTIQAVHRVRNDNVLKVVSKEPSPQYKKHIDIDWWLEYAKSLMSDTREFNAVFGEFYSKLIKVAAGATYYKEVDEYGVVCYLSYLTRNNYDEDFYMFKKYEPKGRLLNINMSTELADKEGEDGTKTHKMRKDDSMWQYPASEEDKFRKWAIHYETGLVQRMAKMKGYKKFDWVYRSSGLGRHVRENYNKLYKRAGKKYNIRLLYDLIRILVDVKMQDKDGNDIKFLSVNRTPDNISIKVVGICPIPEVIRLEP